MQTQNAISPYGEVPCAGSYLDIHYLDQTSISELNTFCISMSKLPIGARVRYSPYAAQCGLAGDSSGLLVASFLLSSSNREAKEKQKSKNMKEVSAKCEMS